MKRGAIQQERLKNSLALAYRTIKSQNIVYSNMTVKINDANIAIANVVI